MRWPITLVLFMLLVTLESWQVREKLSIKWCNCCSVSETMAASIVKGMSLNTVSRTFVFALKTVVGKS